MRIAVTGASGFLGAHVLRSLACCADVSVIATSRTRPRTIPGNVHFIASDVTRPDGVFEALGCPDVVLHLAWAGLPNYLSLHHFEQELPVQFRFLRTLVADGLSRVVVTGTCYEYGMTDGLQREDQLTEPSNPYGYAKDALRRQLEFLAAAEPFELTWARLFYMWGDGQSPGSLFPQLAAAVARGEESFPMSRGEQLRDFLPVQEVARLLGVVARVASGLGVVNICSGEPVSIRGLVQRWIEDHGWRITLDLGRYPYPAYEPLAFWGDNSKITALLQSGGSQVSA